MKQESFSDMEYRCRKKKTKREARPSAHRDRNHAVDVSAAMLVQPVRRRGRGRHLRQLCHAQIYGDQFFRTGCRNPAALPAPAGGERYWQAVFLTPSHTTLTVGRAGCPRFRTTPLTGSNISENQKSSVRCKVEHHYRIAKNIFGFQKAVYRGMRKNLNRLHVLLPARICIYLPGRAALYPPFRGFCALLAGWSMENEKIILAFAPLFHFYHYF